MPPEAVRRFRGAAEGLIALSHRDQIRIALAVSGGPDSLALLLLAKSAFPGRVIVFTVDHGLRPESAGEAAMTAALCTRLGVPHRTLTLTRLKGMKANIQAEARAARYEAMVAACKAEGVRLLATAHHADDQAETVLMRLSRGSGLSGLSGIRAARQDEGVTILRPLLGWRKAELVALAEAAGLTPADDPSNRNPAYDRTAARALLGNAPWLDPARITASASHLADAEEALDWTARQAWRGRVETTPAEMTLDAEGLPKEIVRRLVLRACAAIDPGARPDGPSVDRLIARLSSGRDSTLGGVRARHGRKWRFGAAPPRKG